MPKMKYFDGTNFIVLDANDADTVDGKHAVDFTPATHVGTGGSAHAAAIANGANGFLTGADKAKLDGIADGAEVNQVTFSNVEVKTSASVSKGIVAADTKTDTLTLKEGTAIIMTTDTTNDIVTVAVDSTQFAAANHNHDTVYVPLTRTLTTSGTSGLTGGGDLTANRTLAVNFTTSGGNNGTATTVARGDHTHGLGGLSDVLTTGATTGQHLRFNGTNWANSAILSTDLPAASTSVQGAVQLNDTVTSTSTTQAATANAVKQVQDYANAIGAIKYARLASTANIATLSGLITIDGVMPVANDRVLLKNQTTASQNGIYVVGTGTWTRATDHDSAVEIATGLVVVTEGTNYADTTWVCTNTGAITVGTTSLTFDKSALRDLNTSATSGLTHVGTTLNVNFTTSGGNNGTATTVARGDHNHDNVYVTQNTATVNQSLFVKASDGVSKEIIKTIAATDSTSGYALSITGSGATYVGGGESAHTLLALETAATAGTEHLHLVSDNDVYVKTNIQSGVSSMYTFTFDETGTFEAPSTIKSVAVAAGTTGLASYHNVPEITETGISIYATNAYNYQSGHAYYANMAAVTYDKVWYYNGSTYSDVSNAMTSAVSAITTVLGATAARGTYTYIGHSATFTRLFADIATAGVGVTLAMEYWNGTAWTALTKTDGTTNLTVDGWITWTAPAGWATTTVSDATARYYVRLYSSTTVTTAPTASVLDGSHFNGYLYRGRVSATDVFTVGPYGDLLARTLRSTVATGSAPLVVASTTKVTNLNADLLDDLDSTAFAKVGSSNTFQNTQTINSNAGLILKGTTSTDSGDITFQNTSATELGRIFIDNSTGNTNSGAIVFRNNSYLYVFRKDGNMSIPNTLGASNLSLTDAGMVMGGDTNGGWITSIKPGISINVNQGGSNARYMKVEALTGAVTIRGNNIRTVYEDSGTGNFQVQYVDGTLAPVIAKAFNTSSSAGLKKDITDFTEDALSTVANTKVHQYRYKTDADDAPLMLGLIIEESPAEIVNDGKYINQYAMTSYLWRAVQQLEQENADLKARLDAVVARLDAAGI